jgi:peroxiredoxin
MLNIDELHDQEDAVAKQLNMGDLFPEYTVQTVDGRTLHLPQDLSGEYSVLIFYRGSW